MADIIQLGTRKAGGGYVETEASCRIERRVTLVHSTIRGIAIIVGPPGVGKTRALTHCAETMRDVRYMAVHPSAGAVSASLALACEAFDAQIPLGRARMHDALCDRIERCLRHLTLIVDEAQNLSDQALDQLRCVHDRTGLALVFAGNGAFRTRFNNSHDAAFAQFTSRVGARLVMGCPSAADAAALCRAWGIDGGQEVAWITSRVERTGSLRVIEQLVPLAGQLVRGPGAIRLKQLKDAAELLEL